MSSGPTELLDVCVVGLGAIGALYSYALEKSGGARVTAVCRSRLTHVFIEEDGLDIDSEGFGTHTGWKPYRVVRTVEEAADRDYSYIICAAKSVPEVITTPTLLSPLIARLAQSPPAKATGFVLLQNGIGIEDDLLAALAKVDAPSVVISGCCWVDTTAIEGGRRIVQSGNRERLVLGYHSAPLDSINAKVDEQAGKQSLKDLCGLFRAAGGNVEAAADIDVARWRKVLWNVSFSTLCTLTRAAVGETLAVESSRTALKDLMHEVLSVARAFLPPSSSVQELLSDQVVEDIVKDENPNSKFRPSMLVDLDYGRPMEVEAIVGGVLRRAKAKNVLTPKLDLIYAGLSVIQRQLINKP
ncbi:ketopantoate reductase PanE/ApbA C terminal-domain-containing protein [Trametes gibbosa]|nr:ketopantoate reductase PanE/ApbA C terminal-domain-containing protein [Trametes gibbosa]